MPLAIDDKQTKNQDVKLSEMFGETSEEVTLDALIPVSPNYSAPILFTEEASADVKAIVNTLSEEERAGSPEDLMAVEHEQNEQIAINKANEVESAIGEASSPDEVATIIKEYSEEEEKEVDMADIKTTALSKRLALPENNAKALREIVEHNLYVAEEIEKLEQKLWEGTPWYDVLGDLTSLVVPVFGYADEEIDKYALELSKKVKALSDAGKREEVEVLLDSLYQSLEDTSMTLTRNNNSLLTLTALDRIKQEFRDGAPLVLELDGSAVERGQYVGTVVWGGLEATGIGVIGRFAKGLSTILKRVLPRKIPDAPVKKVNVKVSDDGRPLVNVIEKGDVKTVSQVQQRIEANLKESVGRLTEGEIKKLREDKRLLRLKNNKLKAEEDRAGKLKPAAKRRTLEKIRKEKAELDVRIKEIDATIAESKKRSAALREANRQRTLAPFRSSNRQVDGMNFQDGSLFRQNMITKGIREATREAGLSQEEAIARQLPSTGDEVVDTRTVPNSELTLTEVNELNLITENLSSIKAARAMKLQKELGEAATVQTGNIRLIPNADKNIPSLGTFEMNLTGANGSFFDSAEEALAVQKKLFGYESEILQVGDKFTVKVKVNHSFNPDLDVATPEGMSKAIVGSMGRHLIDPLRKLGKDWLGTGMVLSDVNSSTIRQLTRKFNESIGTKWKPQFQMKLGRVLERYQELGEKGEDLKFEHLQEMFQGDDIGKLWESFKEVKTILDEIHRITDRNFRMDLEKSNFRLLNLADDDSNYVRQLTPDDFSSKNAVPVDGDELVYNPKTGSVQKFSEIEDTSTVVMAMRRATDESGEYRLLQVDLEDVKPLPKTPLLNKRQGYIPRMYKDTGWIVRTPTTVTIGGKAREIMPVTHIVSSREEAIALADKVKRDAIRKFKEENSDMDELELAQGVEQLSKELESKSLFSRSRENNDKGIIFANEDDVSYGFGSVHTRSRGEQLEGSEGKLAPVLDPLEAISKRINSLHKDYNRPAIAAMETKFKKHFSQFLDNKEFTPWNDNLGNMLSKAQAKAMEESVKTAMEDMHDYIRTLRGIRDASVFEKTDNLITQIIPKGVGIGKWRTDAPIENTAQAIANLATNLWIVGRPLFQVPTNALQVINVLRRYPVSFTKTGYQAITNGIIAAAGKIGRKDVSKYLSKNLGVSEEDYKKISDYFFNKSGLYDAAAFTDDIMNFGIEAGVVSKKLGSAGNLAKEVLLVAPKVAKKGSMGLQERSLRMVNMAAFWTELQHDIWRAKKAGKSWKWDNKTAERIHLRSRQITNTQNNANRFAHQDSQGLSLMFKFTQHIQKMFLDDVLDPFLKATTGKTIGKEDSINAEGRLIATQVTLFNLGMFGGAGLVGAEFLRDIYVETGEAYPEIFTSEEIHWKTARFILQGGLLNQIVSGGTSRVNPAAILDTFQQYFTKDIVTAAGGAPLAAGLGVVDAFMNAKAILDSSEALTTKEAFTAFLHEMATPIAAFKDAERAYIAYKTLTHPYMKSLSGNIRIQTEEAIANLFSVTPEDVLLAWDKSREVKGNKRKPLLSFDMEERITDVFIRMMNREIAEKVESGEDIDSLHLMEIRNYWTKKAKQALGNTGISDKIVEDKFLFFTMTPNQPHYEDYVKPFINKNRNLGEAKDSLTLLLNQEKVKSPERRDDKFIQFLESVISLRELGTEE